MKKMEDVKPAFSAVLEQSERIWEEVMVAYSRYYPGICLEGLRKTTKTSVRIAGVPSEVQTKSLSIKAYRVTFGPTYSASRCHQ
jgi:hypothetical protein